MTKYNIYIICKNEKIFLKKCKVINEKYRGKICHIQWIPAEYLTLTQCNRAMLKKLKTLYNTKEKSIIAKLGCIAAHRKALLAIFSNQTRIGNIFSTSNNDILTDDKFALGGRWLRGFDVAGAGSRNSRTSYVGGNNLAVVKPFFKNNR